MAAAHDQRERRELHRTIENHCMNMALDMIHSNQWDVLREAQRLGVCDADQE